MSARGMIRVDVHRAQDAIKSEPVSIATIQIHEPFPESDARPRAAFDNDAAELCRALIATLPGGTIDALLVRLLDHRRSLLGVTHTQIGMSDDAYALLGELVKVLARGDSGEIMKAIDKLSPVVGAEVREYGAEDTYVKRW